jgi:ribosomal protein L7/L12
MANPGGSLPPKVVEALNKGNLIEAIKLMRSVSGLGLAEAKSMVEQHLRAQAASMVKPGSAPVPPAVVEALKRGDSVAAVRLLRERTGAGLKEAKDALDASRHATAIQARGPRLSPGEVPRSGGGGFWWIAVLAIGALASYYFLVGPG